MLTRTPAANVLLRRERLRAALPNLRQVRSRLSESRQHSLLVQDRVDRVIARCNERYGYGRRS